MAQGTGANVDEATAASSLQSKTIWSVIVIADVDVDVRFKNASEVGVFVGVFVCGGGVMGECGSTR